MKRLFKIHGGLVRTSLCVEIDGDVVTNYPNNPYDTNKSFGFRYDRIGIKDSPEHPLIDVVPLPEIKEPNWLTAGVLEWRAWRKEYWLQEWIKGNPDAIFMMKAYLNYIPK